MNYNLITIFQSNYVIKRVRIANISQFYRKYLTAKAYIVKISHIIQKLYLLFSIKKVHKQIFYIDHMLF